MNQQQADEALAVFARQLAVSAPAEGERDEVMRAAAALLNARQCSLMVVPDDTEAHLRLRLVASAGELPDAAWIDAVSAADGIAGQVMLRREPVWVPDIATSPYKTLARRGAAGSFICVPLEAGRACIGVFCVSEPLEQAFSQADAVRARIVAALLAHAVQVIRLDRLLHSRVAQLSLARAGMDAPEAMFGGALPPTRVAKMLAKSFYRDLSSAGFAPPQIVEAASEIIGLISGSLARHRRRLDEHD
ncbi:GAF domain-containing protein [Niveibacterium sp. 24ML]|uniref:GAF domain-containing protein n=1 Tax=Niveibacterium sp. 24ML TaxID=2985512 RepID=UPI0022718C17|nr:GAF domain-containing protein [Niveibacterium sp. 24ML]MCX9155491.1 GAF domain-containing protein [Niveibacterium sp. 24ML]